MSEKAWRRAIVTMEHHQYEVLGDVSNSVYFQWPRVIPDPYFTVAVFSKSNMSKYSKTKVIRCYIRERQYQMDSSSMTRVTITGFQGHGIFRSRVPEKWRILGTKLYYSILIGNPIYHIEWYRVWWPWLTSKRVARVCQHQLSLLYKVVCTAFTQWGPCLSCAWLKVENWRA